MLSCYQARLLLRYGAQPGTPRNGVPELGFHLAECAECRSLFDGSFDESPAQIDGANAGEHTEPFLEHLLLASEQPLALHVAPVIVSPPHQLWQAPAPAPAQDPTALPAAEAPAVEQHDAARPPVTYRSLLRNPNFFRLWLGQAISTFGSFFTRIAVPIYVFSITSSYSQLGFAYFSSVIASLLFGLVAGVVADRWDRRRTMVWTAVANAVVLSVLIGCILLPLPVAVKLGAVYGASFVAATLQELFRPVRMAIFVDVLAEDELLAANSLDGATTTFGEFLSYPIAALALYYIGPAIAFAIDAVSFVVSALLIAGVTLHHVQRARRPERSFTGQIVEGWQVAYAMPLVRKILLLSLVVPLFISLLNTLQLPYAVDALHSSQEVGFPALEGAMALGVVIGLLLLGRVGQRIPRTLLLAYGIVGYGFAIAAQGLVPTVAALAGWSAEASTGPLTVALYWALPCAVLSGAANSMINTSNRTLLQEHTPRVVLGRVYSVVNVTAGVGFAAGALLTGIAQGRTAQTLFVVGLILILLGLGTRWWLPERAVRPVHRGAELERALS